MKQSTFSAVMANSIKNLWQGYTKGIRFVAILTMLLTVGIGSAWGATDVILWNGSSPAYQASTTEKTSTDGAIKWKNSAGNDYSNPTRIYSGNTLTISVANTATTKITKIVAVCTSATYASAFGGTSVDVTGGGTADRSTSGSTTTITITGKATSVAMKMSAQSRVSKLTVTYETATSYTVTWTINPTAGGTLSATSGNSTTVSPNAAYTYGAPAYTVTPAGKANVSQDGDNFTATPSANCTIQINMVEKPKYTVNWYVNGSKEYSQTDVAGTALTGIPVPTTLDCDGEREFVGWTTQSSYEHATNAPTDLITNTSGLTMPENGANYYAVFAEASGDGEDGWQKVTSTDQVKDGEMYAFISFDDAYYLANAQSTSNPPVKSVSKTNGILNVTNEMKWIASANSGGFEFKSYSNNDYYLWGGSANDAIRINTTSAKANATKVWYTKILNTYGVVIYHNASTDGAKYLATNGSTDWRNYLDNNTLGNTNRVANLYKFTSGTTYSDYTTSCSTETLVSVLPKS